MSHDGKRAAFHLASLEGYQVWDERSQWRKPREGQSRARTSFFRNEFGRPMDNGFCMSIACLRRDRDTTGQTYSLARLMARHTNR